MLHLQCGALMKSSLSVHYIHPYEFILRLEQMVANGKVFGANAATCWLAILKPQFWLHGVIRYGLGYTIMG